MRRFVNTHQILHFAIPLRLGFALPKEQRKQVRADPAHHPAAGEPCGEHHTLVLRATAEGSEGVARVTEAADGVRVKAGAANAAKVSRRPLDSSERRMEEGQARPM